MILVIGATSRIGREAVRILAEARKPVRVLAHHAAAAAALQRPWVDVVRGDLSDRSSFLKAAFRGVKRCLLAAPAFHPRAEEWERNAREAARGVRLLVRLSAVPPGGEGSLAARTTRLEGELEVSGLPFVHLRTAFRMQSLFHYIPSAMAAGVLFVPESAGPQAFVDERDVGAVAAGLLAGMGEKIAGRAVLATGSRAVDPETAARLFAVSRGRPLSTRRVPEEELQRVLEDASTPEESARVLAALWEAFRGEAAASVTDTVHRLAGKDPIPFEEFAQDFAQAFDGKAV